ncbi:MAG: anti-sigma factor [Acidobacteriota bacterium]
MTPSHARERVRDLQASRATVGLDLRDRGELDLLLERHPELDDSGFELAAAAVELMALQAIEPLPVGLRARLERSGREAAAGQPVEPSPWPRAVPSEVATPAEAADVEMATSPADHESDAEPSPPAPEPPSVFEAAASHPSRPQTLPWILLAAALAAATIGWLRPTAQPEVVPTAKRPTLVESRTLLASQPGSLSLDWTATEDLAAIGLEGDVVWHPERQAGFLTFSGLAANDPALEQYQLWIFDATRPQEHPIDGGVFDVSADGVAVIPIRTQLEVREPTLFAVTVEAPGGVVVSGRERIVALAQVS